MLLRPWRREDAPAVLAIFAASTDLDTQYPWPVRTLDDAAACLERMLAWQPDPAAGEQYPLAVVVDGTPVANVGLAEVSRRHGTAWVSYFSSGAVRGRGHVRRALAAVVDWAFTDLDLFRLELGHRTNNPASGTVAEAVGFVPEGVERAKLRHGDERFDVRTLALLATDPRPAGRPGEGRVSLETGLRRSRT
ncbi:GNAT family N-acetyltransferase [Nocardioides zeae]|uniref:GNAT family N-acetyltransferase n=1 Tax=Nocardioides zeae TaxID=1457234 RepID=A0A6P0HIB4_9ACTN|nr:GNAT family protein [Nocardioides zeae]NEN78442.1 GNAT family N-acetyltransferase [Nocardioides zeae]